MRVSTPLPSGETRRRGSTSASSARQTARASARSGRSCSSARKVLCAPQVELAERPADGRAARRHARTLEEPGRVLGQRPVVALGHEPLELVQRGGTQARRGTAGVRLRLPASPHPPRPLPATDRALAHPEQGRDRGPAQSASLARQQHPLAQLGRVRSCHGPPLPGHTTAEQPCREQAPNPPEGSSRLQPMRWSRPPTVRRK
jgi:hypothetical protein